MRPRRFPGANAVFELEGGTEDNSLWTERGCYEDGVPFVRSVWEPTAEEREAIAAGANISLVVIAAVTPPVAVQVTTERLGR